MVSLTSIKMVNFRSYPNLALDFNDQLTVIYGHNGAGKTNLLEAISLLTPGRGLRGAGLSEILLRGNSEAAAEPALSVAGQQPIGAAAGRGQGQFINSWSVSGIANDYKLTTGFETGAAKRSIKIDGEKQKGANVLAEYLSAIWLTPQMDGIFLEGNTERRQFFDRIIYNFDPEHAGRVAIYENAMRERLKLLKNGYNDKTWLKVLERRMAEYGVAVAAARNEVIGYLQESLDQSATSFPRPEILIRGQFETMLHHRKALEVEDMFANMLLDARYDDSASGRTGIGVHKTDFHVINTAKNMQAALCSTGEQKALLLSIIMGLARLLKTKKNKTPLVLLDEVIAHLDENRRNELFSEVFGLGCQSFMTGTEKAFFAGIKAGFLQVKNGSIFKE